MDIFFDAGLPADRAAQLHGLLVHNRDAPPDDATLEQWAVESRRAVRETYGEDGERRLALVRDFVNARPGLKQLLNESGVGSHPRVVLALVERANELRVQPRRH